MAEKGKKLRLNVTVPNNEPLMATYDADDDSWVINIDVSPNSEIRSQFFDALIVMQESHQEIHEGHHFFIGDAQQLTINQVFDVQFFTADNPFWKNFEFTLSPESETEWFIYEGVTVNTPGTQVIPRNNNRNSAGASSAVVRTVLSANLAAANAATDVSAALELDHGILGSVRSGGLVQRDDEIILRQNTMYCFRAIATVAGYISFLMKWYEHNQS